MSHPDFSKEKLLEALLFSSSRPLRPEHIAGILKLKNANSIPNRVAKLNEFYETHQRAFRVHFLGGGYQLRTIPEYAPWIKKMDEVKVIRLSDTLLQTLSIIAYKQPIVRSRLEAVRGVDCSHGLRQLLSLNLIRILGKSNLPGRPILYGTTNYFLEIFGYSSLDDLPKPDESDFPGKNSVLPEEEITGETANSETPPANE